MSTIDAVHTTNVYGRVFCKASALDNGDTSFRFRIANALRRPIYACKLQGPVVPTLLEFAELGDALQWP